MTESERTHTTESAEGDEPGDEETGGRTPHSEQPAEGDDTGNGGTPVFWLARSSDRDTSAGDSAVSQSRLTTLPSPRWLTYGVGPSLRICGGSCGRRS